MKTTTMTALAATTSAVALAAYDHACKAGDINAFETAAHLLASVLRKSKKAAAPDTGEMTCKALAAALKPICGIVERGNTIPILSNVRLTADGKTLRLQATDMDAQIVITIPAPDNPALDVTVGAKALYAVVSKASGPVALIASTQDPRLLVSIGTATFKLATLPVKDMPEFGVKKVAVLLEMDGDRLRSLFESVAVSISAEETRYYLNGAYVHSSVEQGVSKLNFVAADGSRLMRRQVGMPEVVGLFESGVIIPRKVVQFLVKHLPAGAVTFEILKGYKFGAPDVGVNAPVVRFTGPGFDLISKVIDGNFPDYMRVIPRLDDIKGPVVTVSDPRAAAASVRMAIAVSTEKSRAVRLIIERGKVGIQSRGMDTGLAKMDLPGVEVLREAPSTVELAFNGAFFCDMMGAGDMLTLAVGGPNDPARIDVLNMQDGELIGILMPLRA